MRAALNKEFNDTITKQQAQMNKADSTLKQLQEAFVETGQKINTLTTNLDTLTATVNGLGTQMTQMREQINEALQKLLARDLSPTAPTTPPTTTTPQQTLPPTVTNTATGNDGQVATGSDIGLPEPPAKRQSTTVDDAEFEDADEIAAPTAEQQQAVLQQGANGSPAPAGA